MLIERDIVRFGKTGNACYLATGRNAHNGSAAFVSHIDCPLIIDGSAYGPGDAGGEHCQFFSIQTHTIDVAYRAIRYDECITGGVLGDVIDAVFAWGACWN